MAVISRFIYSKVTISQFYNGFKVGKLIFFSDNWHY